MPLFITSLSRRIAVIGLIGWMLAAGRAAPAAEPATEFLQGLRDAGYYDLALIYIEKMEKNNLAPQEFRQAIGYEKGVTLIRAAQTERDTGTRERLLDEAQKSIREFLDANLTHNLAADAMTQLGNLLVERARLKTEQISRDPSAEETLRAEARKLYDDAHQLFVEQINGIKNQLQNIPPNLNPKNPADSRRIEQRDRLRAGYLSAQLLSAVIMEETAETAPKGSDEYKKLLKAAADEFQVIYEKYRTRTAGLYARLYQARCYQKMEDHKQAVSYLYDLLEQPDAPDAFRTLRLKTLNLAMNSWLDPAQAKYLEAITRAEKFVDTIRPTEQAEPDWLELQLTLAQAHKALAEEQRAKKETKDAQTNVTSAIRLATAVSKHSSEFQKPARQILVELGRPQALPDATDPQTFDEAKTAGKDSLQGWQTASQIVKTLPGRIAAEKDPEEKASLEKQLADSQKLVAEGRQKAIEYFEKALTFATAETPSREVNIVHYYLSYLHFTMGNYLEAGVIGEFVARRYPSSEVARHCGRFALASFVQLHTSAPDDDTEFEKRIIMDCASYLAKQWPNEEEGELAAATLVPFLLRDGKVAEAKEVALAIPEDSPKRSSAEIKVGQALWYDFLRGYGALAKLEEPEKSERKAELDKIREEGKAMLAAGLERSRESADIDAKMALATLSLGQIYVYDREYAKTVELFEDARIGPLTLLEAKNEAVDRPGYPVEVYKAAVKSYLGTLSTAEDLNAHIEKVRGAMAKLNTEMESEADGASKLLSIYVSLAANLRNQIDHATPDKRLELAKAFRSFLLQVQEDSNDFSKLYWVAETFQNMGDGLRAQADTVPEEAKDYYALSAAAYDKILQKASEDKTYYPEKLRDRGIESQIVLRRASTMRARGDFEKAIEIFSGVLAKENGRLNVQVEAARTLQDWAAASNDSKKFYTALAGDGWDEQQKRNAIWGWAGIASRTAQDSKYQAEFFEAQLNVAKCRIHLAAAEEGDKKTEELERARRAIFDTMLSYPELGNRKDDYDAVFVQIQQALGEAKPHGLDAALEKIKNNSATSAEKVSG